MEFDGGALSTFLAKEEIRELVLLYSRGIDRRDWALIRSLYTDDGFDSHGDFFNGTADEFIAFLDTSMPATRWTGHFVANHLISVDEGEGEGEVYALAYHLMPDSVGAHAEDLMMVRYLDSYRKERGRWRFANRSATFDMRNIRLVEPAVDGKPSLPEEDPSYRLLKKGLFARGPHF